MKTEATPNDIPWIDWHGGPCPVPGEQWVEFETHGGKTGKEIAAFLKWDKDSDSRGVEVLRYRPTEEPVPQQPAPAESDSGPIDRDIEELWCRALVDAGLNSDQIQAVTSRFLELRAEKTGSWANHPEA